MQQETGCLGITQRVPWRVPVVGFPSIPGLTSEIGPHNLSRTIATSVPGNPIDTRSSNGNGLESVRVTKNPGAEKPSVTPAHHAQAVWISDSLFHQEIDSGHDVVEITKSLRLDVGQSELASVVGTASEVGSQERKPFLQEQLNG